MFRITRPFLDLKVKFRFSAENVILCILKGEMPFKLHKNIFSRKICVPTLPKIFRPVTRHTRIFSFGFSSAATSIGVNLYVHGFVLSTCSWTLLMFKHTIKQTFNQQKYYGKVQVGEGAFLLYLAQAKVSVNAEGLSEPSWSHNIVSESAFLAS